MNKKERKFNSIFNNPEAVKNLEKLKNDDKIVASKIAIYRLGLDMSRHVHKAIMEIPNHCKPIYGKAIIDFLSKFLILSEDAYNMKDYDIKLDIMHKANICLREIMTRMKMLNEFNVISIGMFAEFANVHSQVAIQLNKWINSTKSKIDKEKSVDLKTNSDKIEFDEIEF